MIVFMIQLKLVVNKKIRWVGISFVNRTLVLGFFLFLPFLFVGCSGKQNTEQMVRHPNMLFISIDDLNDWVEPLGGNSQSLTPNLDAFGNEAVTFNKNYCTSPGCNPSRSTLMTGLHTYNSGMYSNYQDWRKVPRLQEVATMGEYFREHGYYSAGAGKIFHYSQVDLAGWDDYYPSIKNPMPSEYIPENAPVNMPKFKYMYGAFDWSPIPLDDNETADFKSVLYISEQLQKDHDKPFFLAAGIYRPHLPWYVPQKYFDKFPISEIQLPAIMEDDITDLGKRAKELIERGGNYHRHIIEAGQWENAVQGYLASIAYADAMVGKLLDALEQSQYSDNTIVVIWSDHGWQLGEKKHWRKFALWENVIRTLLMMKVPEGIQALPQGSVNGAATESLTSLLDIYPTLVELANLPERDDFDGKSLIPLLTNPDSTIARPIITTYDFADYSVRYNKWHYISYVDGSEELYNLEFDPEEWNNLANEQNYKSIKKKLADFIPEDPIPLPESSLIPLQEHHVPPVKSKEYYYSKERQDWVKKFQDIE